MTDQNKIALLALLLVLVIAIWTKPAYEKIQTPPQTADVFQVTEKELSFSGASKEEKQEQIKNKILELKKTGEGPFGDSPFR
ncbi:MAG: hypothetical protein JW774_12540 [Candidatus Aureabacteria bacterium]|nr:hypothetical protein [Candidatus Auribacterota bacterium]